MNNRRQSQLLGLNTGITWLGLINSVLQLFFVRITRCRQTVIKSFKLQSVSVGGGISGVGEKEIIQWYAVQYWIAPFTGWTNDFKHLGEPKFIRITKKKTV